MSLDTDDVRRLVSKWGRLLEGVDDVPVDQDFVKKAAATLLEREVEAQKKPWLKPGWHEHEPSIVERIAGLDDPLISKRVQEWDDWVKAGRPRPLAFSRIRPAMIHNPIIAAQPMSTPVGGIDFYLPRYGSKPPR